jgi:hypothetical protein
MAGRYVRRQVSWVRHHPRQEANQSDVENHDDGDCCWQRHCSPLGVDDDVRAAYGLRIRTSVQLSTGVACVTTEVGLPSDRSQHSASAWIAIREPQSAQRRQRFRALAGVSPPAADAMLGTICERLLGLAPHARSGRRAALIEDRRPASASAQTRRYERGRARCRQPAARSASDGVT